MSIPGGLLPFCRTQWFSNTGQPLAAGTLNFFLAGTSTSQDVCSDPTLLTSIGVTVTLDANGRTPTNVYLRPLAYKVVLQDSGANVIWTADNIEDVGSTLFGSYGTALTAGGKAVANNYSILGTDNLVTVSSTAVNPTVVNLPAATARVAPSGQPLFIQNVGTNPVNVTPHGTDTINGVNALKALPPVSGGNQPTYALICDGVSAWFIVASFATSASPGFGTWDATRTVGVVYQAATDGFVLASINVNGANGTAGFIDGFTDSSSSPSTLRINAGAQRQDGTVTVLVNGFTMPVRKSDFWEVTLSTTSGSPTVTVFWLPSGS
jgi:hypothetical protein